MKLVKWQDWPYLIETLKAFEEHDKVIIAKARQLGISWLVCGYCLWKALFFQNVRVLIMSQGEDEARDMVAKCRFIWQNIEGIPVPSIGSDNRDSITFPVNDAEIKALASTPNAGRSTDATLVVRDELFFHEYAEVNSSAIGPTVDSGGQLIELSTIDKTLGDRYFLNEFKKAVAGAGNKFPIFLGWDLRPVRDEKYDNLNDWYDNVVIPQYSEIQREGEYPRTQEELLKPTTARCYFDPDALNQLEVDTFMGTVDCEMSQKYREIVKVWKTPMPEKRYVVYCDPSDGKDDPHVTIVLDAQTKEQVAESSGKVPIEWCSKIYDELVRYYNNAFNSFGLTGHVGGAFAKCIEELHTPNPYRQQKDRLGTWESSNQWKASLGLLEIEIRNKQIRIHSPECIAQFRRFIQRPGEEPQAVKGEHDDYVAAWRGVLFILRAMPIGGVKVYSFKYNES